MAGYEPFPQMLDRLLKRESPRLSQRLFAKKAGISGGYPAHFISGDRPPPVDKLDAMADALELKGEERGRFMESAHLAHSTDEVRALVRRLRLEAAKDRSEIIELRETVRNLRSQLSQMKAHVLAKGIDLPKGISDG